MNKCSEILILIVTLKDEFYLFLNSKTIDFSDESFDNLSRDIKCYFMTHFSRFTYPGV